MTTISLSKPVVHGPATYAALHFRRPKFGDTQAIAKGTSQVDFDDTVALVARLADVPLAVVSSIDFDDLETVIDGLTEHLAKHMPRAPAVPKIH